MFGGTKLYFPSLALLVLLFFNLHKINHFHKPLRSAEKSWIEKLDQIIEDNLDNPSFDSEWLCRESGISRSQLYRVLKEHSGLSPSLYFRKKRLIRAKVLLEQADLKIAEIAYRLGIDSPQNFSKYFSQEYGLSPTDYRKALPLPEIPPDPTPPPSQSSKPSSKAKFAYSGLALLTMLLVPLYIQLTKPSANLKGMSEEPQAYRAYLLGLELINSRTQEKLEAGLEKFTEAIRLDPEFAMAHANRAVTYHLLNEGGFISDSAGHALAEHNSYAALEIDPQNSLAYANLGNVYRSQYRWSEAKEAYQKALAYDPDNALTHYWLSLLLRSTGNTKEAILHSAKAAELDPLNHVINAGHIINCIYGGELDRAANVLKEGELLFNDAFTLYWTKGTYHVVKEEYTQALEYYQEASKRNPQLKVVRYQIAFCKARAGKTEEVYAYLDELPDLPENYVSRSVIYAGLHDTAKSLAYLQKATDRNILPTDLKVLPFLSSLHPTPEFQAILKKFGL